MNMCCTMCRRTCAALRQLRSGRTSSCPTETSLSTCRNELRRHRISRLYRTGQQRCPTACSTGWISHQARAARYRLSSTPLVIEHRWRMHVSFLLLSSSRHTGSGVPPETAAAVPIVSSPWGYLPSLRYQYFPASS